MTLQYIHPTPVYSCLIDNLQDVHLEIEEKINGVKFQKLDKWGGTHYLSAPTFNSNIIQEKNTHNNERVAAVEEYILKEAMEAGVVREIRISHPKNPNKWGKTLAPWFND